MSLNIDEELSVFVESSDKDQQEERRRYFRIDDEIVLIFKEVGEGVVPNPEKFENEEILDAFSLSSALDVLTQESRVHLKKLERRQPDVAEIFKNLERKIDLIVQNLLVNETQPSDRATQAVNISAAGIAFDADNALEPGAVIQLKMILPPSLVALMAYGKVVYCNKNANEDSFGHRIGVDFLSLREQDRELLIRYIVKRQIQQIKNREEPA